LVLKLAEKAGMGAMPVQQEVMKAIVKPKLEWKLYPSMLPIVAANMAPLAGVLFFGGFQIIPY